MKTAHNTAAPHGAAGAALPGTVFLLCFGEHGLAVTAGRTARHYLGYIDGDYTLRDADSLIGCGFHSSGLVRAAREAGCDITAVRTWTGDRDFVTRLRKRAESPRLCPACVAAGRARGALLNPHPGAR